MNKQLKELIIEHLQDLDDRALILVLENPEHEVLYRMDKLTKLRILKGLKDES